MDALCLHLGRALPLDGRGDAQPLRTPAHHLVLHGVAVGMTGSGKTGLITVLVEEALRNQVPVLMIDVKGDLPNLLLALPDFEPASVLPWAEALTKPGDARPPDEIARSVAEGRAEALAAWGIGLPELASFRETTHIRVITPGSSAGESLHVLSTLARPSPRWQSDPEAAHAALSAEISLLLRLLGREPEPAKSKEHVLLSVLAERRLRSGRESDLGALLEDVITPPIETIGVLGVGEFLSLRARRELAAALNGLLASPTFESWRSGATLDVGEWLTPEGGRTPAVIVSVAHLDDDERSLVLGLVLEEVLSWVRSLPGSQSLRALIVFDEVYGYLPPHPKSPPTKRPLVALMKQGRAFGVGTIVATQNPMDLDYRALSNAGSWWIGRLQTDADRTRVIEGLTTHSENHRGELDAKRLNDTVRRLAPRWFVMRDAASPSGPMLLHPRTTMSLLRGPMTRGELRQALGR